MGCQCANKTSSKIRIMPTSKKIDLAISRMHFTKEAFVKIEVYQAYHTIHPSNEARGVSAVIVKDYEERKIENDRIQATTVNIHIQNKKCNRTAI